nr:hypothetical protein [Tanacetum cinerariifolium]
MTDNLTMAEMLCAPTEGCAEAIVVPPILAEQFEPSIPMLRLLRKSVLPVEVLIRTTSDLPPVATLSQSTEITFKVTFQQPQATSIRVIQVIVLKV